MQAWFDANGTYDWYHRMDDATNSFDGYGSVLDCTQLDGSFCRPPFTPCAQYTPPELRLIQIAGTRAHDFFSRAHDQLQTGVIQNILSIDQIILDFAPVPDEGFNYVDKISKSLSFVGGVASLAGVAVPVFGAIGAVFSLAVGAISLASASEPTTPQYNPTVLRAAVSNQLEASFTRANLNIESLNAKLFGGTSDTDLSALLTQWRSQGITNIPASDLNPITQIFSTGDFLAPPSRNDFQVALSAQLNRTRQSLVAGILRANNYFIFIDTSTSGQTACSTTTGSRTINGECMVISKRLAKSSLQAADHAPVDRTILLKLDDPNAGYNIDPEKLYRNALDCNGRPGNDQGGSGDEFPQCFFSLPIIRAPSQVCCLFTGTNADLASIPGCPAGLQLTQNNCDEGSTVCIAD